MFRALLVSAAFLTGSAAALAAQNGGVAVRLSQVAGTWDYRAVVGATSGVMVASVLTATASKDGWTMQHATDAVIPLRVLVVGGDSIVAEAGPYPSTVRPGQTVERNHIILHYDGGDTMKGAFEARYASGDVVSGRVDAVRRH
jgi:hypothetical protein